MQLRGYLMATDAESGVLLLYLDREGSNFARQFPVPRDDGAVRQAVGIAERVAELDTPPPVLEPVEKRGQPVRPWQCDYCPFLEVSCPGAAVF